LGPLVNGWLTLAPYHGYAKQAKPENKRGGEEMSNVALRRRIAALVVMAFLSMMGATVAAATVADSADGAVTLKVPRTAGGGG
jgi:hypothetical protein